MSVQITPADQEIQLLNIQFEKIEVEVTDIIKYNGPGIMTISGIG